MSQAQTQGSRPPAQTAAEQSEFQQLLAKSADYRQQPLQTPDRLLEFLDHPDIRSLIERAFPGDLTDSRRAAKARSLVDQARVQVDNSDDRDKLLGCTTESFVQALASCAAVDLSLQKALGQAYLVRFLRAATLMIGYQGFITLIMRTGVIASIQVDAIYKGENYDIQNGKAIEHHKRLDVDRTPDSIVGVYAEARNIHGPPTHAILGKDELLAVQNTSKAKYGPWKGPFRGEMQKKTAIRRLQKQLPKGSDEEANRALGLALEMDNRDFGLVAQEADEGLRDHGRRLRADAAASRAADEPRTADGDGPGPQDGGANGSAAKDAPGPKPKADGAGLPDVGDVMKFMARVAKRRAGDSSLSDEAFVQAVIDQEFKGDPQRALSELTLDQFRQVGKSLKAGHYEWDEGKQVPPPAENGKDA